MVAIVIVLPIFGSDQIAVRINKVQIEIIEIEGKAKDGIGQRDRRNRNEYYDSKGNLKYNKRDIWLFHVLEIV